jgi:hypothetical protein
MDPTMIRTDLEPTKARQTASKVENFLKYTVIKNNSLNILYYNTKLKFKNS